MPALLAAGHDVTVLTRNDENAATVAAMGARSREADLFDVDALTAAYDGADAVVNLATHRPVGYDAVRPGAWRRHDRLRTSGTRSVVEAARRAGVRRVVQESVTYVYADSGDDWIDEDSRIEITVATEPAAVAESAVSDYSCDSRTGVVLRFGMIVGDDPMTRFWLRAAGDGRPVGVGSPENWRHVVHTDDLGAAVVAALGAPTGIYNVGAAPVRTSELVAGYAAFAGVPDGGFLGPVLRRLAGRRIEPMTRSLRVRGDRFAGVTGWTPVRPVFEPGWFDAAADVHNLVP